MNILFIEDERELRETGVAQLELRGYTVYPVSDLAAARSIMDNANVLINMVLADHNLTDGMGVDFLIEMKELYPDCIYAIVSGCLTHVNVETLKKHSIPFFRKPLLYGKVVETLRREHLMKVPVRTTPVTEPAAESPAEESSDTKKSDRKKWFGLL